MKNKTLIIVIIVIVLGLATWLLIKNKKKKGFADTLGGMLGLSKPDNDEEQEEETGTTAAASPKAISTRERQTVTEKRDKSFQHTGKVPKGSKDDKDFFIAIGFSRDYLSSVSKKDAKIARDYVENYVRKGRALLPTDKMYKDVKRIASYTGIITLPKIPKVGGFLG